MEQTASFPGVRVRSTYREAMGVSKLDDSENGTASVSRSGCDGNRLGGYSLVTEPLDCDDQSRRFSTRLADVMEYLQGMRAF